MEDICTYQILVRGQAAEVDLQPFCPPGLTLEQLEPNTLLTVVTDQSGIIGLIRNLHGLGLMLLSVNCLAQTTDKTFSDSTKLGWRE